MEASALVAARAVHGLGLHSGVLVHGFTGAVPQTTHTVKAAGPVAPTTTVVALIKALASSSTLVPAAAAATALQ